MVAGAHASQRSPDRRADYAEVNTLESQVFICGIETTSLWSVKYIIAILTVCFLLAEALLETVETVSFKAKRLTPG